MITYIPRRFAERAATVLGQSNIGKFVDELPMMMRRCGLIPTLSFAIRNNPAAAEAIVRAAGLDEDPELALEELCKENNDQRLYLQYRRALEATVWLKRLRTGDSDKSGDSKTVRAREHLKKQLTEKSCLPHNEANRGLVLQRYFGAFEDHDTKGKHLLKVASIHTPEMYEHAYNRWREDLQQSARSHERVELIEVEAQGRLVTGTGAANPLETDLHLNHVWGTPVLPGSGLKGVAAKAAELWLRQTPDHIEYLFGDNDDAGLVIFHDAWWVPSNKNPVATDVTTAHQTRYHGGDEATAELEAPDGRQDPNPIPSLSVQGTFTIALSGPPYFVKMAKELLVMGLEHRGFGAKTSSGYGRLKVVTTLQPPRPMPKRTAWQAPDGLEPPVWRQSNTPIIMDWVQKVCDQLAGTPEIDLAYATIVEGLSEVDRWRAPKFKKPKFERKKPTLDTNRINQLFKAAGVSKIRRFNS